MNSTLAQIVLQFTPLYSHYTWTDTNIATLYVKLILWEVQSLFCDNRASPSALYLLVWVGFFSSSEVCRCLPNKETQSLTNIKPNRSSCVAGKSRVHSLRNQCCSCMLRSTLPKRKMLLQRDFWSKSAFYKLFFLINLQYVFILMMWPLQLNKLVWQSH